MPSPPIDDDGLPPLDLGTWTTLSPLPTPRQEMPLAVLDGKIYVPGGITAGGTGSAIVEVYNPASDSWSTSIPMPERLHHFGLVAAKRTLFILGGYVGNSFSPTSRVFELNLENEEWLRKAEMPTRRGAHVAVAFDDKIFVIGGADAGGRALATNEMFDPETNSWATLTDMPTPREHLAAAVIPPMIYVVGGRSSGGQGLVNQSALEAYSPSADQWTMLGSMPTARGGLAAASLAGKLYAFGGEFPGVFFHNQEYNPATDTWQTLARLPTARHGMGAGSIGSQIFVIGGGPVAGFGVTGVNEAFTPPPE